MTRSISSSSSGSNAGDRGDDQEVDVVGVVTTALDLVASSSSSSSSTESSEESTSSTSNEDHDGTNTNSTATTYTGSSSSASSFATPDRYIGRRLTSSLSSSTSSISASPASSKSMNRSVKFNALVGVMEVLNKEQYYRSEKVNTWYSNKELLKIQRESLLVCKRHQNKCSLQDDCIRGLECQTPEGFNRVRKNRLLSKFAVLEEQKKLRQQHQAPPKKTNGSTTTDPHTSLIVRGQLCTHQLPIIPPKPSSTSLSSKLIGGKLYRTISNRCLEEATKLASQDLTDAQNYHLEPASNTTLAERFRLELFGGNNKNSVSDHNSSFRQGIGYIPREGGDVDNAAADDDDQHPNNNNSISHHDCQFWFLLDPAKWLSMCFKQPLITE